MSHTPSTDTLFRLASEARGKAYAPYSRFQVGAAVESTAGNVYTGCNVENVSYPIGTCAEESAISAMINGGDREIRSILIVAGGQELIAPCGACLQRIKEFSTPETTIYLADTKEVKKTLKIQDLLPFGFTNEDLKK